MIHMFEEIPTKHSSLIHWDYHMRICLNQHIWEVEVQPNTFNWWWLTRCLDHLNVEAKVKSSWESESYPPSKLPFAEPTNGLTAPPFSLQKSAIGSPLFPMGVPLIEVTIRFPLKSSSPGPWVFWIQCRPRQKWSSHWDLLGGMSLVEVLAKCGEVKTNKALIVFDYDVQYECIEVEATST